MFTLTFISNLASLTVEWANLATLDLSRFDEPGGKEELAKQLHEAIKKIGQCYVSLGSYYSKSLIQL
jgi:isopenicillin N synthase-like dioxygenase